MLKKRHDSQESGSKKQYRKPKGSSQPVPYMDRQKKLYERFKMVINDISLKSETQGVGYCT